ncbi:MAG: putative Ig domain-containing protein [Gammaproteobacteria bacterium]|nr:putative Ig domain-containing protein [Gammaproteobacteria bacterium]
MHQQRGAGRLLRLTAVILILQGCGSSEESDDTATVLPGEQDYALELSGSVGDGPVIDSTLTVLAWDNQVLNSTLSDQLAGYNLQVRTKGKHYPLTIQATGGLDLVTRLPLDFTMLGAVTQPRQKVVANVNPFSTLAVAIARQMNGGLGTANLSTARDAVVTEFNLGMTSALSLDPLGTPISNGNLAEIVKSAEALAEIFRRTATTMQTASFTASIQFVIDAIAADLVDGVLDGRGAGLTNRHVSAITMLVAAQVSMESIRNELTVNGRIATPVLDGVITQLSGGQAAELTDARPVTSYLIGRALQGVDAAILLGGPSALDSTRTSLMTLRPGTSAATARQALPNDAAAMLDGAITQLGGGSTSDIDIVLTGTSIPAPANTAPTISGVPPASVAQDALFAFVPTANDADGDTLTFILTGNPSWLTLNAVTGEVSGTPRAADVGTHPNIQLSVTDGQATSSLSAFSITVVGAPPPNNAPVISGTPATSVLQGAAYQFVPAASDADGDSLTFSIANRPVWATFNTTTGSISGTPLANDVGSHGNIVISVSDGQAIANLPAFSIAVQALPPPPPPPPPPPGNTPPVISGAPATAVSQNTAYQFVPSASDADGDTLTFSIVNRPAWAGFNTSTGSLSGTPTANDVGTYGNVVISVSDGQASASLPAFTLVVQAVNTPPVISGTPATAVSQNTAYQFVPSASDVDGDTLTFSIVNRPAWAGFNTSTGSLSGTPTATDVGTYANIVISVSDGQASASLPAFTLDVQAVNTPPVIAGSPTTSVLQDTAYQFAPAASDADGDALSFSIANQPGWATFNSATGVLDGTPTPGDVGTYPNIVISVSDGQSSASLPGFSITVNAVSLGSATLSWQAPTTYEDGSPLNDLAGYRIYWGQVSGNYPNDVIVMNPGLATFVVDNLTRGTTYYFAVKALNSNDVESTFSNEASKLIP